MVQAVSKYGFEWNDVETVFPAQGFVDELSKNGVLDSAKFQNAYITGTVTDPEVSLVKFGLDIEKLNG